MVYITCNICGNFRMYMYVIPRAIYTRLPASQKHNTTAHTVINITAMAFFNIHCPTKVIKLHSTKLK